MSLDIGDAEHPTPSRPLRRCGARRTWVTLKLEFNVGPCQTAAAWRSARCGASLDLVCVQAAAGNRRAAIPLRQLYESGEGVPSNADLARAWYAAAGLPAARERMGEVKSS